MSSRKHVSIHRVSALTLAAALSPIAFAQAPQSEPAMLPAQAAALAPAEALDHAERLIAQGRLVESKAVLQRLLAGSRSAAVTGESRQRAFTLLGDVNSRLKSADPLDVSLQKSDLALREGDMTAAERHADAVGRNPRASQFQREAAAGLLERVRTRREEMTPQILAAYDAAVADFHAGRVEQAKAGFDAVARSGVRLEGERQRQLAAYQMQILESEHTRQGVGPAAAAALGVLQPGTIERRQEERPAEPAQPESQPPAEDVQPADEPPPPLPPPAEQDLIEQARRYEAQDLLQRADRAFDEARLNEAVTAYTQLRDEYRASLTPEQVTYVENRLAEALVRMRGVPGTQPIEQVLVERDIIRSQTMTEFNNDMEAAERALATGDTETARNLVARAGLGVRSRRAYFSDSEFEALIRRTETLQASIAQREVQIRQAEQAQRERELQERIRTGEAAQAQEKERKINELIDRARAYQQEMRYAEALQAVEQLLFLDPINPAGLMLRDVLSDVLIYRDFNAVERAKHISHAKLSVDNQRAAVPEVGIVNFPEDWAAISYRRGEPVNFAESNENRQTLAKLEARPVPSYEFNNNPLGDVLTFLATVGQVNIDVDWGSLQEIGIEPSTTVSLRLSNATLKSVLDRILEKASPDPLSRAGWAVRDGIVIVGSDDMLRRDTVLVIYDISDMLIEIPDYDDAPEIDLQQAIQSGQGGGGGQSPFQDEDEEDQDQNLTPEERIDTIVEIIQSLIDPDGWVETGGSTGTVQRLGSSLIITNTAKNHREIAGLLSKLREIRAMQINVETRFLLVNQDFFEQIGFDLDVYINSNNNQVRALRGTAPTTQPSDMFTGGRLNRRITVPDAAGTGSTTLGVPNPRSWSPIGVQQDSLGLASALMPDSGIAGDVLSASPALGIAGQFLDDIQVDFLVQATQADRRSISLTAPRLTFTNGQTANIYVVTQQSFVSDLQPVVGDSAVGFDPDVDVVSEGVTLLVEGTVSADRRYVTMNVDAGVARIDGFGQQAVTAVAGGQLVNSADTQSFIQLPIVTVTRVRTTVTVPDQGTILLGGQRLVTEVEVETGVPVLSKMPIFNRFFTNRIESKEEQTLLILMKPTVLIQNEEEERHFPGLIDSIKTGFTG